MENIPVEVFEKIEDGEHAGEIKAVTRRTDKFDYTDYIITPDAIKTMTIKTGFPTAISVDKNGMPLSLHASFLHKMGILVAGQKDVQPANAVGRRVKFTVIHKREDDGKEYPRISRETLRPS